MSATAKLIFVDDAEVTDIFGQQRVMNNLVVSACIKKRSFISTVNHRTKITNIYLNKTRAHSAESESVKTR